MVGERVNGAERGGERECKKIMAAVGVERIGNTGRRGGGGGREMSRGGQKGEVNG